MKNKKLRICTITHHTVPNYGAVLQTYALQKAIKELGYDSEVLDYRPKRVKRFYHKSFFAQNSLKEMARHIIYFNRFKHWNKSFDIFIDEYVKTSRVYSENQIKCAGNLYDLYISGSDQVWNLMLHQGNTSYFLDFVKNNSAKGSYAASFGYSKVPDTYYEITKREINKFQYINVRESQGLSIAKDMVEDISRINCVIDPTFLLERDHWNRFIKNINEDRYILVYEICRLKESFEYAIDFAKRENKKIISIQSFEKQRLVENDRIQYLYGVSPQMFLSLISNADCVITSSFHGTVFSIMFERPFLCALPSQKNGTSSRIVDLLKLTGLNRRIIGNSDMNESIDYNDVNKRLNAERDRSKAILKNMLDNRFQEVNHENRT